MQTTKIPLNNIDVRELLPQQEPFIMIDSLVFIDERSTITTTKITNDNIFVDDDIFSASGLIENIAQTCAARIGYLNKSINKEKVQIGFIGAIKNFEIFSLPHVNDIITTKIEIKEEVFGLILISANIICNEKIIAQTEMKIALKEN